jgi:hypothetical protein
MRRKVKAAPGGLAINKVAVLRPDSKELTAEHRRRLTDAINRCPISGSGDEQAKTADLDV